ncbi:ribokinase [Halomonas sp. EGI 63088]|uniref:Ribokinase n=1 Tax=Halomonas flagellata TaxID=2920385 RepID=A0ABS9RVU5_9GAMM|nr:ribokinase [Halomonas flagellata]MCH4563973.1 ribokinase [Halomonas flagellata]
MTIATVNQPHDDESGAHADVVVVGSLNMDLVVRAPRHPQPGETLTGHALVTTPGGKGANQAVALARLGASTAMIGCVGDDAHGHALLAGLDQEGILRQGMRLTSTRPTGVAMIQVDDASQNCIVVIPGSNAELLPADVERGDALLRSAKLLVCQLEVPLETVRHALDRARRHGCTTLLNAAPAMALPNDVLARVDWLVVNETEAAALSGQAVTHPDEAAQAAQRLRRQGCRRVLVTLGAQGVVAACDDSLHHYPAPAVTAMDTTAAGDTFVGGFAAALAREAGVETAIREGQAAAAIAVTRAGAQSSIPHRDELVTP